MKCQLCQEEISDSFNYCPKCGYALVDYKKNQLIKQKNNNFRNYSVMPTRLTGLEDRVSCLESKVKSYIDEK